MNTTVNKFLVAAVTVLGATGALMEDGISANDVIAMVILFANALGVYAIPNKPNTGATLYRSERGGGSVRYMALVALATALIAAGCSSEPTDTAPAVPEDEHSVTTRIEGDVTHFEAADHSFNEYHAGAYYYAGQKQSDVRYVLVMDRTTYGPSKSGLQAYVQDMQRAWGIYPGLPYLYYVDDSASAGACYSNETAGNVSNASGLTSMILVCNGSPRGDFGYARWAIQNQHLIGEANIFLEAVGDAGLQYTGMCHEIGHVIQFPGHSNESSSCMKSPVCFSCSGDKNLGYTGKDLSELLSNYYSHPLGGES